MQKLNRKSPLVENGNVQVWLAWTLVLATLLMGLLLGSHLGLAGEQLLWVDGDKPKLGTGG
ncbi:MAG: hypothetical protein RMK51_11050 [Meiothermus sp.]|uniref:hypothetical protein n=1 Tax=Meiothermus sp. TaxID=1955249 RepID=UPI00298ED4D7|nr:hypothetical protein [Meiothermus sp.]MDW8426462.1 hypothetical protein [Meiothermus sp.]